MTINTTREHSNWEFLPGYVRDIPVYFFWLYFFIKSGHPFFFSNVNPGMLFSGFVEVSKYDHMKHIDPRYLPAMCIITSHDTWDHVQARMQQKGLTYPLIAKPNIAGRNGTNVEKIFTASQLQTYCTKLKTDVLIQELIDYPLEFGVFYYRLQGEENGHVTGMVGKEFLGVEGNGVDTLHQLIATHPRAKHYIHFMQKDHAARWESVIPLGELIQLNYIGNHCKGSIFYDRSSLVTPELEKMFDTISKQVPGFYCGRYDVKTQSVEDLYAGNFKILELNGVVSEPTWIYDPSWSFWKAYKVMFWHWDLMYRVSKANLRAGYKRLSLKEAWRLIKRYGV